MSVRTAKVVLVFAVGFYGLLVVFNNITDYSSNFEFVSHVLSMDTVFEANVRCWRSIQSNKLHHCTYISIIGLEAIISVFCTIGSVRLAFAIHEDASTFNRAKGLALIGLTTGFVLFFGGFICIGGEFFLMWQSESWNGQATAFRVSIVLAVILNFVASSDHV